MCKECKRECVGKLPCLDCAKQSKIVIPNWIVAGLITLLLYFMII